MNRQAKTINNSEFVFSTRTNWNKEQNDIIRLCEEIKQSSKDLIDLTESNPTKCQFPYPNKLLRALSSTDNFNYEPVSRGSESARQAIAGYYRDKGIDLPADDIVITSSTSEGYSYLFRLLANVDDEILFPQPSYPLFSFLIGLNDAKMVRYHLHYDQAWHVDINGLKGSITDKTKAICFVNPNNPTGSYITEEELDVINQICLERGLAIICDEVFLDFSFDLRRPVHSILHNKNVLTFVLGGLSKYMGLPQMKVSWIAVNGPDKAKHEALARLEIIADTYLSVNTPSQNALSQWFKQGDNIRQSILDRVKNNFSYLAQNLKKDFLLDVQGGWYAIIRLPSTIDEEKLAVELLKKDHVYVHPGYFYDFSADGYLVLSLLVVPEVLRQGIERILLRIKELQR